jgi:peroxiredoxin
MCALEKPLRTKLTVLEAVTNVAILAGCLAMVGMFVLEMRSARPSVRPKESQAPPVFPKAGERLLGSELVRLNKTPYTLLAFVREDCRYCQDSLPFYRQIQEKLRQSSSRVHAIAVTTDEASRARTYLQGNGLSNFEVASFSRDDWLKFRILGTPTLVMADQSGLIKQIWVGRLTAAQQQDVLNALDKVSSAAPSPAR